MIQTRPQLTPEVLVPRLGDYLVEKKLITPQDLKRALEQQQVLREANRGTPLLGQILMNMGVIDRPALDNAVTEQIIQLREALTRYNQELERRVAERTAELQNAMQKLSELNLLKTNFVSNISHELRTPLTHIKGYMELLRSEAFGALNTDQKQNLTVMAKATDRLGTLIEDLILFSVTERDQLTLQVEPFKISEMFHTIEERVKEKAKTRNVKFLVEVPPAIPLIKADPEKIQWVISQLLDNAFKFTPQGGTVTLSAQLDKKAVHIIVNDTGIGIPSNKYKEIFEPFHQLDGSSTRKFGGTGLGLALVQKIIDAHGSIIRVKSQVGKGSNFEFLLNVYEG
jgi:signal transduction histidine kinase